MHWTTNRCGRVEEYSTHSQHVHKTKVNIQVYIQTNLTRRPLKRKIQGSQEKSGHISRQEIFPTHALLQRLARQQLHVVLNVSNGIQIAIFRLVRFNKGPCAVYSIFNRLWQGYRITGDQVVLVIGFGTAQPNICGVPSKNLLRVTLLGLRKFEVTLRLFESLVQAIEIMPW